MVLGIFKIMEWIKVSKRKPNYWYDVMLADMDGNIMIGFLRDDNVWISDDIELRGITHFSRLPLPPK